MCEILEGDRSEGGEISNSRMKVGETSHSRRLYVSKTTVIGEEGSVCVFVVYMCLITDFCKLTGQYAGEPRYFF